MDLHGRGLILHHWDTDGIASAALLSVYLKSFDIYPDYLTPVIGNYYLSEHDRSLLDRNLDFVITVDLALPEHDVIFLAERYPVVIVDHHLTPRFGDVVQINPVVEGLNPELFPSATWVITSWLGLPHTLLEVLGALGDREEHLTTSEVWPTAEKILFRYDLTFRSAMNLVHLIDSNYRLGRRDEVISAVRYLIEHAEDPFTLLSNPIWTAQKEEIDREMERILTDVPPPDGGVIVHHISTRYDLISAVAREIARRHRGIAVVVNSGFYKDRSQIYVRRSDGGSVEEIISLARARGYSAGGKREVTGIVLPSDESDAFLREIIERLEVM